MKRLDQISKDYQSALEQLTEAIEKAVSDLEIDGAIQRFEFTFELMWKYLKVYFSNQGLQCNTPRQCLKQAYAIKMVDDEKVLLRMLEDRNKSVHIYSKQVSRDIFGRIKNEYLQVFVTLIERLK